jgi:hypothetical protein
MLIRIFERVQWRWALKITRSCPRLGQLELLECAKPLNYSRSTLVKVNCEDDAEVSAGLGRLLALSFSATALFHFTPDSLTYAVPLFRTRQCDRTLQGHVGLRPVGAGHHRARHRGRRQPIRRLHRLRRQQRLQVGLRRPMGSRVILTPLRIFSPPSIRF